MDFLSSAIDSRPTIGVTESLQKFSTLSCNDGGCDPDRRIGWFDEHSHDLTPRDEQAAIIVAFPL